MSTNREEQEKRNERISAAEELLAQIAESGTKYQRACRPNRNGSGGLIPRDRERVLIEILPTVVSLLAALQVVKREQVQS